MTRMLFALTAAALVAGAGSAFDLPATACYGTTVHFVESPKEAAAQARKDEKLVMILHVSGNFEDPKFT